MNNIGERIRHLRKDISLTLTEFGEHIGITAASLSAIETGKTNPSELTIRAICREFGFLPGRVHVELLREVGKSGEERNRISRGLERRTKEKEAARKAVAQLLGKSPETVSAGEVQRYELWRQQDGKCAYYMLWRHAGGERAYGDAMPQGSIPPAWLADGVNAVQVDHILPRSRTFDNSFHNLCLCCHAANQAKGGRTSWEWLGAAQPQAWHDFEQWVQSLPLKGLKKRNYLLRDLNAEVQGRFHARNLTDSGYVARLTLRWLEEEYARHDVPMQDADGRTLYTATALGSMSSVIFSSSDIKEGETYTVLVDGASVGTATAKLGTSSSSSGSLGPDQNGGQPGSDQQNGQQGGVSGFQDVGQNDWFASAVRYVTGKSLMNGESTTAFAPNENMSRAMLATMLYRMSGETAEADSSFRDVSSSAYYAAAVNWASSEGIVNGTGADVFSPNASIPREQLAAMLYRYAGEPSVSADLSAYTDTVDISPYASKAVEWCVAKGILSGESATRLAPQDTATRAECAAMLQRFAAL